MSQTVGDFDVSGEVSGGVDRSLEEGGNYNCGTAGFGSSTEYFILFQHQLNVVLPHISRARWPLQDSNHVQMDSQRNTPRLGHNYSIIFLYLS